MEDRGKRVEKPKVKRRRAKKPLNLCLALFLLLSVGKKGEGETRLELKDFAEPKNS